MIIIKIVTIVSGRRYGFFKTNFIGLISNVDIFYREKSVFRLV